MAATRWLTVAEVAELLGCSASRVYALVAEGKLPSVALGRRIRVPRAALAEMEAESLRQLTPRTLGRRGLNTGQEPPESRARFEPVPRPKRYVRSDGKRQRAKSRGNGSGSVIPVPGRPGTFYAQWHDPVSGRRRVKQPFVSRSTAERFLEITLGAARQEGRAEVLELDICDWVGQVAQRDVDLGLIQARTAQDRQTVANIVKKVLPKAEHRRIYRFASDPDRAVQLVRLLEARCRDRGSGWHVAQRALHHIRKACAELTSRMEGHVIAENPFEGLQLRIPMAARSDPGDEMEDAGGSPPKDARDLDFAEIKEVAARYQGTYLWVPFILLSLGLRPGELGALIRSNLDLSSGVLEVNKGLKRDGRRGSTKTPGSRRRIVIPPSVLGAVRDYVRLREESLGRELRPDEFIFCNSRGQRWVPHQLSGAMRRGDKTLGTGVSAGKPRHFFATIARLAGVTKERRDVWMGHSSRASDAFVAKQHSDANIDAAYGAMPIEAVQEIAITLDPYYADLVAVGASLPIVIQAPKAVAGQARRQRRATKTPAFAMSICENPDHAEPFRPHRIGQRYCSVRCTRHAEYRRNRSKTSEARLAARAGMIRVVTVRCENPDCRIEFTYEHLGSRPLRRYHQRSCALHHQHLKRRDQSELGGVRRPLGSGPVASN